MATATKAGKTAVPATEATAQFLQEAEALEEKKNALLTSAIERGKLAAEECCILGSQYKFVQVTKTPRGPRKKAEQPIAPNGAAQEEHQLV